MMTQASDSSVSAIFRPQGSSATRALVVAGACGNVGFGKLGQFARILQPYGVPIVALDPSPRVLQVKERLREAFGGRFSDAKVAGILDGIQLVQGGVDDIPVALRVGFVFEAIPERLDLKRTFYRAVRARDPQAYIFSATSGITSRALFSDIPGAERSGVMHPFFPHLTNKLWEVPVRDAVTSSQTQELLRRFLAHFGMTQIGVADAPAFAADRVFCGMMLEAVRIHVEMGLRPAQVDDACKQILGTSPFFVHNMIPGANYLSAHCMKLLKEEVDSTLYDIPEAWQPYVDDPLKKFPYERGEKCPPDQLEEVKNRLLGMLFCLTAYMLKHNIAGHDTLNYLCENALGFRMGTPALVSQVGFEAAQEVARSFLANRTVTRNDEVAPLDALDGSAAAWRSIYVGTSVRDEVGLLSLKRATINQAFIAELDHAYEQLSSDDAVKAIVIAPDGQLNREFGHGADPNEFSRVLGKYALALNLIQRWTTTLSKLRRGKPTVAALVGRVLGGGLELACSCHARIAGAKTVLALPEPTVGVVPGLGGCHHIHRFCDAAAYPRINELLLTGHRFSAEEASELGLVSEVVPISDLPAASFRLALALGTGTTPLPAFREGPATLAVARDVDPRNDAGAPHDAKLRELIAATIEGCNALPHAEASALSEQRAAESLTMSSSAIGVKALSRGKTPQFKHPLV
ncbi:MAG: enoyl-CoA hydratase-related protein [Nannocystaceae bacterium]